MTAAFTETGYAEIERLGGGDRLCAPPRRRDSRTGRWVRADGGEWDWYYSLPVADRDFLRRRFVGQGGLAPDQLAAVAGYDSVDNWAADWVAAALLCRRSAAETQRASETVDVSELVGPVEVAAMLEVKVDTVYQWVNRRRLPPPLAMVSGTRLWARADIEAWALESGRLVPVEPSEDF